MGLSDADLLSTIGREQHTPTSRLFFSRVNFEALHAALRGLVQRRTGVSIARQSDPELLLLMRGVYETHEERSVGAGDSLRLVRAMNARVLDDAVDNIVVNIAAHKQYIEQVDRVPVPVEYGENSQI